ncbi:MAG: hypothetical protein NWS40_00745 [Crocinitomicaceae bacterium]|nr:hypothetical protein [Crocinitomicaceae bacterium]MDP4865188.1 hypothetical protein [Crocinitomicaceae bacterium]MDP5010469.1 hypothetical protein [Crocinitomicaceae bacterium]MDP5098689.1 hypothetical protein [Crocinitomicaceae bacterium]
MNTPEAASFIVDRNYLFFTPLDIAATILGIIAIFILLYLRKQRNKDQEHFKYLIPAYFFKAIFVVANALFYIIVYKVGGDSIGYWDGAVKLNNLFWVDPLAYFQEIFTTSEYRTAYTNFTIETGYPDGRIYEESESFFISKIASFFTFFTFKGYILMSLIFAFITTNASWKLFELVRSYKLHKDWHLALAIFFIPSLSFWCGGISKDTVIWVALCYFLHHLYQLISIDKKASFINWIVIFICLYVMLQVRSFMIITVLVPLLFAYTVRLTKKFQNRKFERNFIRFFLISLGISVVIIFFQTPEAEKFLNEAAVINQDMSTNKTYGTNRYNLNITDYSPTGMLSAIPPAVIAGFYRPFIWESLSVSLFLNGIESIVLLYFTFRFLVSTKIRQRIQLIRKHEFLIFGFFFAFILAYFAGFTSILFGVLVRFKAPVLPFLVIILTSYYLNEKVQKELKKKAKL